LRAIAAVLILLALAPAKAAADPVIAAAGDIACDSVGKSGNSCQQQATSDLLVGGGFTAVLTLGDNQYEKGALDQFQSSYGPTWGRVKGITRPAIGNHEYDTKGASGYFSYFGGVAAPPGGYYSYDLGAWHLIALNSNCGNVSCAAGSPQETWLKADLASHPTSCTLAYWHHPRFSSGGHGSSDETGALFTDLYEAGADLVLVGHDHDYERFAPQTADGKADPAYGVREFVVGTGGRSHSDFSGVKPNSQVRNSDTFGVLRLVLHPASYDWRFLPVAGKSFSDAGAGGCHGAPGGPLLKLSKASTRLTRKGAIKFFARCSTSCTVKARATVRFGRGKVGGVRISRRLSPERKAKLRIKFAGRKARALRKALRHRRLRAKITAVATDGAGHASTKRLRFRLRR
jgi:hypothetical protein